MLDIDRLYKDAEEGVLPALKLLGDLYLDGYEENDIEPDLHKALEYYNKACEGGMEDAMMELGYLYCSGEYMEPDYVKGIAYYKQAAALGNTTALGNLGMSYCKGYGVEKDEQKGFSYFLKAAEGGHPNAMTQVAEMYERGYGVERDEEKAAYWHQRAEEQEELDKKAQEAEAASEDSFQDCFKENLDFLSEDTLDTEFVKSVFQESENLRQYIMGKCEFQTGKIITADPLCYLQNSEDVSVKEKSIAPGTYPVQLSVMDSNMAGLRIVGAKLKISDQEAVNYEPAKCMNINFAGYPVECGMGCFCDEQAAKSYWKFLSGWYAEHEDGNIYDDYFEELFAQSYREVPDYQRPGGDFLLWSNPLDGSQIAMFATGLGDGLYGDYWGLDAEGEICELVIIFMNPELF